MSFTVTKIYKDWEEDELLFDVREDGYGEHLYRLDFFDGDNAFQAQMFLITTMKEKKYDRLFARRRLKAGELTYRSARLFIERDNRITHAEGGDNERWDYACHAWRIRPREAEDLLRKGTKAAVKLMAPKIRFVTALPNDRAFITSCDGRSADYTFDSYRRACWERVQKKWAEIDARG